MAVEGPTDTDASGLRPSWLRIAGLDIMYSMWKLHHYNITPFPPPLFFCSSVCQVAAHDWIRADGNSTKCQVCHKKIKTLAGRRCVWCQEMVRTVFVSVYITECIREHLVDWVLSLFKASRWVSFRWFIVMWLWATERSYTASMGHIRRLKGKMSSLAKYQHHKFGIL